MNNVERMIAGLRCCAESKNVCVADECPLFEMCQAHKINPMGVAAEMMEALVQQRDEWERRARDAECTHRTEYCEDAEYDCVTLGKIRAELDQAKQERDSAVDDITKAEPCFACKYFKRNGGTCGAGKRCLEEMLQAKAEGREYKGLFWEWRGVHEVKEDA